MLIDKYFENVSLLSYFFLTEESKEFLEGISSHL